MSKLSTFIDNGTITIVDNEYIGLASDGIQVSIGIVGEEETIEAYLRDYPTPETW